MPFVKGRTFDIFAMLLVALVIGGAARAATLTVMAPVSDTDADQGVVPIRLLAGPGERVCAVQFDVRFDASEAGVAETYAFLAGEAAKSANKQVSFARIDSRTVRVIVAGFNQNIIPDGDLVLVRQESESRNPEALQSADLARIKLSDPNGGRIAATASPTGVPDRDKAAAKGAGKGAGKGPAAATRWLPPAMIAVIAGILLLWILGRKALGSRRK